MSLTSAAISQDAVMTSGKALLKEYLLTFFDGNAHSIGGVSKTFPDLTQAKGIVFDIDEANMPDAASGSFRQIRLILMPGRSRVFGTDQAPPAGQDQVRWAFDEVSIKAFLTAKDTDWRVGNRQVNELGDLLYAVLKLPSGVRLLNEKGVLHVKPRTAGLVGSDRAPMRMLQAAAQFWYRVAWTTT